MSLRDKLLAALADLPGARTFHVHVLTSAPRKHNGLFPYAHPRPRTYLQDVLVLLSEQPQPAHNHTPAPRVLVAAIEASVYTLPSTHSAVLYVSKVDSSGHASAPSPTAALVRAFLLYYADPATRPLPGARHLWVQLFARAQGQYLFPNSSAHAGKRPLNDVRLCAWWKRVFGAVARGVAARLRGGVGRVRLFYVLPGYSELEAAASLARAGAAASSSVSSSSTSSSAAAVSDSAEGTREEGEEVPWVYGHPYAQTDVPLPCPRGGEKGGASPPLHNLGSVIPWFDDDPKSRFVDEIACTTRAGGVPSPKRKRTRASTGEKEKRKQKQKQKLARGHEDEEENDNDDDDDNDNDNDNDGGKEKEKEKDERPHVEGELGQVSVDEFWERMSFRQECVAGAMTGFFTLCVSTPPAVEPAAAAGASQPSPLAPQPGHVAAKMVRRIVSTLMTQHEFSTRERAVRATETLEGAIRGLCEDAPVLPAPAPAPLSSSSPTEHADTERPRTPEPGRPATREVPRTPPAGRSHLSAGGMRGRGGGLPELSPNPFPDPVATPETYASHIYGCIAVRNPPLLARAGGGSADGDVGSGRGGVRGGGGGTEGASGSSQGAAGGGGGAPVTVLAVRKKRKPVPS